MIISKFISEKEKLNKKQKKAVKNTFNLFWSQDGYTLTDPSFASRIHLTPRVMANTMNYGNNGNEWINIYNKEGSITFADGRIDIMGNINKIRSSAIKKFYFTWTLFGQPLTDPARHSLVFINMRELKLVLNAYNKAMPKMSSPQIVIFQNSVKLGTLPSTSSYQNR